LFSSPSLFKSSVVFIPSSLKWNHWRNSFREFEIEP
jgi:hypothetical protein